MDFWWSILKGEIITGVPVSRKCFDESKGKHLLSANPVMEEGKIIGLEGFILDIKETEELTEHMYFAVRNSGAGYCRLDKNGMIVDVNDAWLELYKYDKKEEVIGKHFSFTRVPAEVGKLENTFNKVFSGEAISGKIAVRRCKDDFTGRHILSANPITIGNKIVGMEGFILDIKKLEEEI